MTIIREGERAHRTDPAHVAFFCPGCKDPHVIRVAPAPDPWGFNGSFERPTFTPSVNVTRHTDPTDHAKVTGVCHSFVTDGNIKFLNDCTHPLRGQTVPLPQFKWIEGE